MEKDYLEKIISAAVEKLEKVDKSLSEGLLIPGIVTILKKKFKNDARHTSKIRFKKDSFSLAIQSTEWKNEILRLENGNFFLKKDFDKYAERPDDDKYNWCNIDYLKAVDFSLELLKDIDPYQFEVLVGQVLEKSYKGYKFKATSKSGDGGIVMLPNIRAGF